MPTWEQHQRALGKARAAGDAEAVAEIEANIAEATQNVSPSGGETQYDHARFQKALGRAMEARDVEAADEIANDWMDASEAAGKRSPRQYSDDELRESGGKAAQARDMESLTLLSAEAKRRGLGPTGPLDDVSKMVGDTVDAVVALPGALAKGADATVRDPVRALHTLIRNVPGADFVHTGAGHIVNFLEGDEYNPQLLQQARDEAAAMAQENPLAALFGEGLGAGVVANKILKVPGLAAVPGKTLGNVGRVAATGGATEGIVSLADTGDAGQAVQRAVSGAVLAPIVGAVGKAAIGLVGAPSVRMATGKTYPSGFKKLAQIVKMPQSALEKAFNDLKAVRGGNPSVAEIVDTATKQRLQPVIATQAKVAAAAQKAAEDAELARPTRGQKQVNPTGRSDASAAAEVARTRNLTAALNTHGKRPVVIDAPEWFDRPAIRAELKRQMENAAPNSPEKQVLSGFLQALEGNRGAITATLRDVEALRKTVADILATEKGAQLTGSLGPVRDKLASIAETQIPEYGAAMAAYKSLGDKAQGIDIGKAAVAGSRSETKAALIPKPKTDVAALRDGAAGGFRTKLSEDVGKSFGNSGRKMEQLQNPEFQNRAAELLGPAEAARLATVGKLEGQAARNLDDLDPAPNPRASRPNDNLSDVVGGVSALGPSGAGHKAAVVLSLRQRLTKSGMSDRAATGISEALFDPARAQQAIDTLRRIGKDQEVATFLAQQIATIQAGTQGNE